MVIEMNKRLENLKAGVEAMTALDALYRVVPVIAGSEVGQQSEEVVQALHFADRWLREQDEAGRLAAMEQAEILDYEGVAGLIYAAITWTGGSMVDPRVSEVEPPPELSAKASAGAVLQALVAESDDVRRQELMDQLEASLA